MNDILINALPFLFVILEVIRWIVTPKLCKWKFEFSLWNIVKTLVAFLILTFFSWMFCLVNSLSDFIGATIVLIIIGVAMNMVMNTVTEGEPGKEKIWGISLIFYVLFGFALTLFFWNRNAKETERLWAETEFVKVESVTIKVESGKAFEVYLRQPNMEKIHLEKDDWNQIRKEMESHYGPIPEYKGMLLNDGKTICVIKEIPGLELYIRQMNYLGKKRFEMIRHILPGHPDFLLVE